MIIHGLSTKTRIVVNIFFNNRVFPRLKYNRDKRLQCIIQFFSIEPETEKSDGRLNENALNQMT